MMDRLLIRLLPTFLFVITPIYAQYRYGDIRLVGGSYQWEGRVEIFISGTWGTITDSEWTHNDAQVVCRKLGHFKPGATAHTNAYFGEGSGPIHLDFVQCSGSEYNLTKCEIGNDRVRTSHSFDVGVKCQPADEAYREGDIRLVGVSNNWEGRVEIYWTGTWGTISDTSWSNSDAEVVCRQLGHSTNGVVGRCCGYYGEGSGAVHIRQVRCYGSERNITSCDYINNTVITSHAQDVGVECQQGDAIKEGDIRLVGGSYLWQGRLEIYLDGIWGTIYYYRAYNDEARVACRQLGYNTYHINYYRHYWDSDINYPIHLTGLSCSGSEYRVTDCQYNNNTVGFSHLYDWGVRCSVDGPETRDVLHGFVRVFLSGIWEPVTGRWTQENSEVVCREHGYNETSIYYVNHYTGSWSTARELIDNVACTGTESKLIDCSHDINLHNSYRSPYVACRSYGCAYDIRLVNGESEMEGRVEICSGGRWGTVCDSQWTDNHTAVVCRYLGFSDIIGDSTHFTSETFGEGSGPVFIDYVTCTGSESRLWRSSQRLHIDCLSYTHYYGCSHSGDVGVRCQPASCSNGQIKLIEVTFRNNYAYGRVEICSNQRWETLSRNYWQHQENRVACNALGYDGYNSGVYNYGRGGSPIHQKYFVCGGAEQDLSECVSYNITTPQSHAYDVGIWCYGSCTDGHMRLMEGQSQFEGRLEVCLNRRWGTFGSDGWTQINTQVFCNSLGYDFSDNETVKQSIPQALSKPVHLHNIVCSSTDLHLLECSFSKYSGNINDVQDVIITCQQPTCQDGDLKLVGGISENEGRLEVCFDQRWGTINGDGWTHTDTQVACRQLGLPTSDVSYTKTQRVRSTFLPARLTLVGCYGSEEKLTDCAHHDYTSSTSMDISISCGRSNNGNINTTTIPIGTDVPTISSSSSADEFNSLSAASLSIAIICVFAVIILAVVLIFFLRRSRKHAPSNEPGAEMMTTNADTIRYATSGGVSNISTDTKKIGPVLHDDPMQDYEDVAVEVPVNPLPIPPKPQAKSKKPAIKSATNPSHARSGRQGPQQPAMRPSPHYQFQGHVQQPERSPSPIYESPD